MNDIPLASDSVAFLVLSASSFAGGQGPGLHDECPVQINRHGYLPRSRSKRAAAPHVGVTEFGSSCSVSYQCIGVVPHHTRMTSEDMSNTDIKNLEM